MEFSRVHYIHFATSFYNPSCLPKLKLSPLDNNSPAPSSQPPQTTDLLSVSVNLTPLGTSHEWNQAVFVLYHRLISLSIMSSRFIYILAGVKFSFLFMAEWYSTVQIGHIWLIHSSIRGHLGYLCYFHFLAMVNSASLNTRIQVYVLLQLFWVYPENCWITWWFYF